MAKINITRKHILDLDLEAQSMKGHLMGMFNSSKLNEFYNKNGVMINASKDKRQLVFKEFLAYDESGNIKIEGEGQEAQVVLKEPIRKTEFEKAMNTLMGEQITLEV